ncbi:MAG TPA: glycine zipper 2TM domain-containing protein [Alphaproteobacteria bacterium]|nr:glycine zipper 2TM domain-containing protein [Alphaproteobacteria bacterium]
MKKSVLVLSSSMIAATLLSGCAPRIGGSDYSIHGVGEVSRSEGGTIVAVRVVNISARGTGQDNQPGAGALLGGLGGAVLGSQIGQGKGAIIAGTLGAVGGAVGGHYAEKALTDQQGYEYTIRLDKGEEVTVTQGADPAMANGQRVRVIYSARDRSRVVPA